MTTGLHPAPIGVAAPATAPVFTGSPFQGGCHCPVCARPKLPSWPCERCEDAATLALVPDYGFGDTVFTPFLASRRGE